MASINKHGKHQQTLACFAWDPFVQAVLQHFGSAKNVDCGCHAVSFELFFGMEVQEESNKGKRQVF